jgi:cytoskeletal protein CcmA (bactofilin family)
MMRPGRRDSISGSSKIAPSTIGADISIIGNVTSKGEIHLNGQIEGDVHCVSLVLGDGSQLKGGVVAEDVVVRGRLTGSIRALRVSLHSPCQVEGDLFHQSLAIEQGAHFEGEARRSENPMTHPSLSAEKGAHLKGPHQQESALAGVRPKKESFRFRTADSIQEKPIGPDEALQRAMELSRRAGLEADIPSVEE